MKNVNKILIVSIMAVVSGLFVSCYSPNPLYGTWADNQGSKVVFQANGTYTSKINYAGGAQDFDGTYSVLENVLVFTKSTGGSINTEWDIRGGLLYLTWVDNSGNEKKLMLYHTSK